MSTEQPSIQNPWIGPSSYQDPFKSKIEVKFCGRENETFDLVNLIYENFLVTLYGKSGNGKTSLLQAGVFPLLRGEQYLPVLIRLGMLEQGESFQRCIIESVEKEIAEIGGSIQTINVIDEQTDTAATDFLWNYFARHRFTNADGAILFPVVVFDQFEEILRSREHIHCAAQLLSQLNYITDETHALADCLVDGKEYAYDFNFRFVISIREDELYRLEDCIDNIYEPALKRCRFRLNALDAADAKKIILQPGGKFINPEEQAEVVNRIIDLATNHDDGNISPFMLSLICSELFKKAYEADSAAPQITPAMIDELGQNILRDFYLRVVENLPESERIFFEDNLVDANKMRNSVNATLMNNGCPSWHLLTDGTNRILQETNGKVELVHDQLALAVFDVRESRKEQARVAALEKEKEAIRRKNRRRIFIMSLFLLAILGVLAGFIYQNKQISESQEALSQANGALNDKNLLLEQKTNDLFSAYNFINQKNDSLGLFTLALQNSKDSLQLTNGQLLSTQQFLENRNQQMLANQSKAVAAKAIELVKDGDSYTARLLALEILSKDLSNPDRPYTVEAEGALRYAMVYDNAVLRGHTSRVNSASFSPDGKKIVSASLDGTIRIWDATTGKQIGEPLEGHTDDVLFAAFSPDGKKIVSALGDNTIRIWDATTGMQIGEPLIGHTTLVESAMFSPDGKKIVSASYDKTIRIWDVTTGQQIGEPLEGHTSYVESASFSPDGKKIVSASDDNTIRIWDATTGEQIGEPLEGHTSSVNTAFFSPDGIKIVSASSDKTIRIWDATTGQQVGEPLEGHTDYVLSASFSPDGKKIVSASEDKTIRIWDATTGKQIGEPLVGHTSSVNSASFSPDGKKIVSASWDGTIRIWDIENNVIQLRGCNRILMASFSRDGKKIVSASFDTTIRIWDATTGKQIGESLEGHTSSVNSATFSPDGKKIVSASGDNTIRIWDATTGQQIGEPLKGHTDGVVSASFSPDGKKIVSASEDRTIRIWDATTGKQIGEPLVGHVWWVTSASFSPDGRKIVSTSWDKTIRIWDATTGKQIGEPLEGHTDFVYSASFSPDGKKIVSASDDKTVRIWDATTGKQIGFPLEGHTGAVRFASFSPDGKQIVSASNDGTVRVWDVATGIQIGEPMIGEFASFSSDGKKIVLVSYYGKVRFWDWKPLQELINEVRERYQNRQLTPEERRKYYLD